MKIIQSVSFVLIILSITTSVQGQTSKSQKTTSSSISTSQDYIKDDFILNQHFSEVFRIFDETFLDDLIPKQYVSELEKKIYRNSSRYKHSLDSVKNIQRLLKNKITALQISKISIDEYSVTSESFKIGLESNYMDGEGIIFSQIRVKLESLSENNLTTLKSELFSNTHSYRCNPSYSMDFKLTNLNEADKIEKSSKIENLGIIFIGLVSGSGYSDSFNPIEHPMGCPDETKTYYQTINLNLKKFIIYDNNSGEIIYKSK